MKRTAAEIADTIVMGSRGLGEFAYMFLGGVSHNVSDLPPCTSVTLT